MADDAELLEDLLNMAKQPERFSKFALGEMILAAAIEIIKLREQYPGPKAATRKSPIVDKGRDH